jgi:hypothetical protein
MARNRLPVSLVRERKTREGETLRVFFFCKKTRHYETLEGFFPNEILEGFCALQTLAR